MWDDVKDFIFEKKGAATLVLENKIKEGVANFASDFLAALPIVVGVSVAVYALVSMISSKLAKMGVAVVFIYGALVVIVS